VVPAFGRLRAHHERCAGAISSYPTYRTYPTCPTHPTYLTHSTTGSVFAFSDTLPA